MSFLNAWAIGIGAAALLAPLAVHFLTRPRPVSFPLSTIRFLREVIEQRRARSRLVPRPSIPGNKLMKTIEYI